MNWQLFSNVDKCISSWIYRKSNQIKIIKSIKSKEKGGRRRMLSRGLLCICKRVLHCSAQPSRNLWTFDKISWPVIHLSLFTQGFKVNGSHNHQSFHCQMTAAEPFPGSLNLKVGAAVFTTKLIRLAFWVKIYIQEPCAHPLWRDM